MPECITILSEEAISEFNNLGITLGIMSGMLLFVGILMALFISQLYSKGKRKLIILYIGIILMIISIVSIGVIATKPSSLMEITSHRYYVTISGDVNLSEIYDNFNIEERKGEIWIITTK